MRDDGSKATGGAIQFYFSKNQPNKDDNPDSQLASTGEGILTFSGKSFILASGANLDIKNGNISAVNEINANNITLNSAKIVDHIVEIGHSTYWYYRRYLSGYCEFWNSFDVNITNGNSKWLARTGLTLPFSIKNYSGTATLTGMENSEWNSNYLGPINLCIYSNTVNVYLGIAEGHTFDNSYKRVIDIHIFGQKA